MSSLGQDAGGSWRSDAGQWASGTLKALGTLALSALLVWIAVSVVTDSGLLTPAEPRAEPRQHSPATSSPSAEVAYG